MDERFVNADFGDIALPAIVRRDQQDERVVKDVVFGFVAATFRCRG